MNLTDTHCHLYADAFDNDRDTVIKQGQLQGIKRILMPNIDLESIAGMMELQRAYPKTCYPMMGLHPCSVSENWEKVLDEMEALFAAHSFVAVGETGIDLYWDKSTLEWQKAALARQIIIAEKLDLPIVLHTRTAMNETMDVIRKTASEELRGVFHCFSESFELIDEIEEMGFYFGIGGVLTYKNSGLKDAIEHIPLDRIILETDSPYLAPVPFRGKRNEPSYTWHIADALSSILNISIHEIAEITTRNANRLFFPNP